MTEDLTHEELKQRVSELEQQNKLLQSEAAIYRTLFDSFPHGISVSDSQGNIVEANSISEQLLGISKEEHKKREIDGQEWRIIRKDGSDMPADEWASVIALQEQRMVAGSEMGIVKPDGQTTWINVTAAPLPIEGYGVVITYNDITEKNQVEDALRQSEEKYRKLYEDAAIGIFHSSFEGQFLDVNPALARMLGYDSPQDVIDSIYSISDQIYVDPQARDDVIAKSLAKGETIKVENLYSRKDGSEWNAYLHLRYVSNSNGQPICLEGFVEDITERKQAEEALIESEGLFRAMFMDHSAMMLLIDPKTGQIIKANQAAAQYYGYPLEKMFQMKIQQLNLLSPAEVKEQMRCALKTQVNTFEFQHLLADGRVRDVEVHSTPVTFQKQKLLFSIIHDITEHKRAEEALRNSEEKYRLLADNATDVIWIRDMELKLTYVSPSVQAARGFSPEEVMKQRLDEVLTPDSYKMVMETFTQFIQHLEDTESPVDRYTIELEYFCSDGSTIWMDCAVSLLRDQNEEPVGFLGVSRDITDRKMTENELRESENRINSIFRSAPIGIGLVVDRVLKRVNNRLCEITGYDEKDLIDQNARILYPSNEDFEFVGREKYAQISEHVTGTVETCWQRKDGTMIDILLSSSPVDLLDHAMGVTFTAFDITERRQSERILLHHQKIVSMNNRIASVFLSSSPENLFADVLDVLLEELESSYGYFGYIDEAGDLVCPSMTRKVWDQCELPQKDIVFPQSAWVGLWGRSLQKKTTMMANQRLQLPEGHVPLQNALAVPIVHNDTLIGQFVLANKASGFKESDQELLESAAMQTAPILNAYLEKSRRQKEHELLNQQLIQSQKMESVGRLAGGVAHDFNNMLGVILGNTEMAIEGLDPSQPVHDNLQEIKSAAQRSSNVVRQLLAFARKQTIAPQVLDLNEIVEDMMKILRRLIGEEIDLSWQPGHDIWPVKIDPGQIDQILANLSVNARDAIDGVGRLIIETGKVSFDKAYCVEHPGFVPGDFVLLAVSDNGCGMDGEIQKNLFEPFFTTKKVGKGTGLGLATVYGIVKQNDGFINVYSEPNYGTTFKIYLPRHRLVDAPARTEYADDSDILGNETILLVEDEPTILKMTRIMLESLGYKVLTAVRPEEAMNVADEYEDEIHILMTDLVMPEMNGRDLAGKLLSLYPNLKWLFMSGYTKDVIAHHGVLDECVNFIQKPFSKKDLAVIVRKTLDAET